MGMIATTAVSPTVNKYQVVDYITPRKVTELVRIGVHVVTCAIPL